jgi:hypothetical protein
MKLNESKGTPDIIIDIVNNNINDIEKSISSNSSLFLNINENSKNYNLVCDLEIIFKKGDRYNGNINYKECVDSNFKKCIISVFYPMEYDFDKIIKTLIHELTHLYELYQIKDIYDNTKWKWQEGIDDTKKQDSIGSIILYFRKILSISLPQEINARVSSLYLYLYMIIDDEKDKKNIIDKLKTTREWENYENLMDFSYTILYNDLIKAFNNDKDKVILYYIFNKLNKNMGINIIIKNDDDLLKYLKNLDTKHIKPSANKFKDKMMKVINRIYTEVNEDVVYLTNQDFLIGNYEDYIKEDININRDIKLDNILIYNDFIKKMNEI